MAPRDPSPCTDDVAFFVLGPYRSLAVRCSSPLIAPSETPCYSKPSPPPATNRWCSATTTTPA
ncbi:hypothetical protein SMJ63A_40031 [Stenotrophomonas geniculata]